MSPLPYPSRRQRGRRALASLGGAALLAAGLAPAAAQSGPESLGPAGPQDVATPVTSDDLTSAGVATVPGQWFVELPGRVSTAGGTQKALKAAQQALAREARSAGTVTVERTFGALWNGATVSGTENEVRRVAAAAGASAVYPVAVVDAPEPLEGEQPDLETALPMTGADIVHSELGHTGDGVRVAIMDTGIDYDHPDLGGDGTDGGAFPNDRVVAGYDFVGDSFNADPSNPAYDPVPQPDADPDDCQGHGTHVAGIVGASGELTGVAPEVDLGAYRVFGCNGSTTADIMIAAMEQALADDMDVRSSDLSARPS